MNIKRHGGRVLALLFAVAALVIPASASAASVTPTTQSGNPGCTDINAGWSELKIDRIPSNSTYSDGTLSVTISNVQNSKTFDWASNTGVDAVLVKAGTETFVYSYDPESTGDTNVGATGQQAISHVSFCYDTGDTPPTCEEQNAGSPDSDGDGKVDACDNCPAVANPGQEDADNDGMGDACEPTPTCAEAHAGEADTDGDGVVDACDNCPSVGNANQADANNNGMGDACEATTPITPTGNTPTTTTVTTTPSGEQQAVQQPAAEQPGQIVLGERVAAPTARLISATGCVKGAFNARVRGTRIAKVVFTVDGKRVKTLTKRNLKGSYALRINPAKYRVGVHRLVVKVTFASGSGVRSRTLRAAFQRCARQLVAPRFTG